LPRILALLIVTRNCSIHRSTRFRVAQKVLRNTQLLNKPWQYRFLAEWLGQGLLIASGARWKKSRRMLNHVFHAHLLDRFALVFNREGRSLGAQLMKARNGEGRVADIYSIVERITLSAICETAMGTRLLNKPEQIEKYLESVKLVSSCAMLRSNSLIYRWDCLFWFSPLRQRYRHALKVNIFT
jgi:cytochrome P450 family 4